MPRRPTVSFVSLGCAKNLVDSEKMLGLLAEAGCPIVAQDAGPADVLVINTCGFLAAARDEALDVLREAARQKQAGIYKRLVVAGCLAQRDGERLLEQVPQIDALVGVNNRGDILRAVIAGPSLPHSPTTKRARRHNDRRSTEPDLKAAGRRGCGTASVGPTPAAPNQNAPVQGRRFFVGPYDPAKWLGAHRSDQARLRLTPPHYAYLRISEGCDQKCTFCTIPAIRGPMHSKTPDEVLTEARELVDDGAVELNLIGQETTGYGTDIGYQPGLTGLLRQLDSVDGLEWIRLMYAYPSSLSDAVIEAIADCRRVVKYIDLPLQHINDRVLRAMHRRVTRRQTEALLDTLRRRVPGIAIRTTLIAGSPGETDGEFEELRQFIRGFQFDALGVFAYSNEPDTPAFRMQDQLPQHVISDRVESLMLAQQDVAFAKAASRVGEQFRVLVEGNPRDGFWPARHAGQAPEVDSLVLVQGGKHTPGRFITAQCTGSRDYDLLARPCDVRLPVL